MRFGNWRTSTGAWRRGPKCPLAWHWKWRLGAQAGSRHPRSAFPAHPAAGGRDRSGASTARMQEHELEAPPEALAAEAGVEQQQAAEPHSNGVHPAAADGVALGELPGDDEAMSEASHAREERVVVRGQRGRRRGV